METYRLKSKLLENDREYTIQTSNDSNLSSVASLIYINGELTERVTTSHPEDVDSAEVMTLVKDRHGEMKKEVEILLEAYRRVLSEGEPQTMLHLAMAFYYRRFFEEASRLLRSATRIDSDFHQAFNYLCLTEMALDNSVDAVKAGLCAVKLRPEFADYHNNLGEALIEDEQYRPAMDVLKKASRINLYYADAYINMSLALIQNAINKDDQSMTSEVYSLSTDYINKAMLIAPEYNNDLIRHGLVALNDSDLKSAYRSVRQGRETKREYHRREFSTFYMKYILYPEWSSESAVVDRVKFLKDEIEKNPSYVDLYSELGRCYLEQSKMAWQNGLEQYRHALQMNPSLTDVSDTLVAAEKAFEEMKKVLKEIVAKG